ncbi:hypothetical protein WJX82_003998 [Trebouxia sp. C0006]
MKLVLLQFVGSALEGEAPAPKDTAINIVDVPSAKLYVKEFGGFGGNPMEMAQALRQDLIYDNKSFPRRGICLCYV